MKFNVPILYVIILVAVNTKLASSQYMQNLMLGKKRGFDVNGEMTIRVDLEWDKQLVPSQQPSLVIETSLASNSRLTGFVNFVVLYGSHSEYWKQDEKGHSKVTLCIDHLRLKDFPSSLIIMAQSDPPSSNVGINLVVKKEDLTLKIGEDAGHNVTVTDNSPATFLVNHSSRKGSSRQDTFIIYVDTIEEQDKDICMAIAVYQRYKCPLHDKPENVFTADLWSTALDQATTTLKAQGDFSGPFYVSVVLVEDKVCQGQRGSRVRFGGGRRKHVNIKVKVAMNYNDYLLPILVGILPMVFFILFGMLVIRFKEYPTKDHKFETKSEIANKNDKNNGIANDISIGDNLEDIDAPLPPVEELEKVEELDPHSLALMNESEIDGPILKRLDNLWSQYQAINELNEGENETLNNRDLTQEIALKEKLKKKQLGLMRLKPNPMLSDMTTILDDDKWFRRNRSKVYLYLVPIITIFYFVPSIQYVFQTKWTEQLLGTQDLCFHNFRCSRPFWIFTDFNHIISNISYFIFGLFFIIIVKMKASQLPQDHHPRFDHLTTTGTLQQLSIFYAMGFCLMAEGLFSVCYHVCPTNLSLQFDTTMMYFISILGYVKIYQFRHPNAIQNAYSTFMILGILVLLEAVVLFSPSFWVYVPFILFYVSITFFLAFDLYYHGVGRIDLSMGKLLAKDIAAAGMNSLTSCSRKDEDKYRKFIRYPGRFLFSLIFFLVNIGYAIFITFQKLKDETKTISHVLLVILAGNLMGYLLYYVIRKIIESWKRKKLKHQNNKKTEEEDESQSKCQKINCFKYHPGLVFAILALGLGLIAIHFYQARSANRNLTPAESRKLNSECNFLDFYGKHQNYDFS